MVSIEPVKAKWQEIADAKRKDLASRIPPEWIVSSIPAPKEQRNIVKYLNKYLSPAEIAITESAATELVAVMAKGVLTSVQVTTAFCHRAAVAHQFVNCCNEMFFDLALKRAQELDVYMAKEGKTVGPLHGLPVSLKDQFRVKGVETSMGYVAWLGEKATRESALVEALRDAGAVFYAKTNVPMALMAGESVNNVFGYTWNPINRLLSCGGSSGGEGSLIGSRGSILGVGTDIGGSIRIPAAFQGLFGLRPSHGRMPYARAVNSYEGQETVPSVCGPIAHNLGDIKLFVKSVLGQKPWFRDPKVIELEWRESAVEEVRSAEKLCFGIMKWDGVFQPHPPIVRGVEMVADALRKSGHEVVEWEPYQHQRGIDLIFSVFRQDGGKDVLDVCEKSGEPVCEILNQFMTGTTPVSCNESWDINLDRYAYQQEAQQHWNDTIKRTSTGRPIDAFISPVAASAAVKPGGWHAITYTPMINLLDYSACVVPVTHAVKEIDVKDEAYVPTCEKDRECWESYDPDLYDGAPVSVQVVARRLQEEKVLTYAEIIDEALKMAESSKLPN